MTLKTFQKLFSQKIVRTLGYALIVTLPVFLFIFKFSVINRNGIFRGEDWDYFAQSYEAARQSILHYHQFPCGIPG